MNFGKVTSPLARRGISGRTLANEFRTVNFVGRTLAERNCRTFRSVVTAAPLAPNKMPSIAALANTLQQVVSSTI